MSGRGATDEGSGPQQSKNTPVPQQTGQRGELPGAVWGGRWREGQGPGAPSKPERDRERREHRDTGHRDRDRDTHSRDRDRESQEHRDRHRDTETHSTERERAEDKEMIEPWAQRQRDMKRWRARRQRERGPEGADTGRQTQGETDGQTQQRACGRAGPVGRRRAEVSGERRGAGSRGGAPAGEVLSYMTQHLVLCVCGSLNRSLCLGRYFSR